MAHTHSHTRHFKGCVQETDSCRCEQRRYELILGFCVLILIVQLAFGKLAGSLALLADSAHVAIDFLSAGIAWAVAGQVRKHQDPDGLRRRGMQASALLLLISLIWISYEAYERFSSPQDVNALLVIIGASIGFVLNGLQLFVLHDEHTATGHAMRLHLIGDFASSGIVIIGGVVALVTRYSQIDVFLSVGLVLWMLPQVLKMLSGTYEGHHHAH